MTSEIVVATTASVISLVASIAGQAEQCHIVQRKVHCLEQRERCDDGRGDRKRGNRDGSEIPDEEQDDQARQQAAIKEVFFQSLDGSIDEDRLVRNDLDLDSRRQTLPDLIELLLDEVNDRDCIGAGLAANIEPYAFLALNHVPGVRLCKRIFNPADIVYPDRRPIDVRDDDVAKLADGIHAPQSPHADFAGAPNDAPSGDFNVLILNGALKLGDGDTVRIQFLRVGVKAYLARPPSSDRHGTNAIHSFQHAFDLLFRDFRRFANVLVADDRDCQNGRGIRVGLLYDWRENVGRKISKGAGNFLTNVLGGAFNVSFQNECAGDPGRSFRHL